MIFCCYRSVVVCINIQEKKFVVGVKGKFICSVQWTAFARMRKSLSTSGWKCVVLDGAFTWYDVVSLSLSAIFITFRIHLYVRSSKKSPLESIINLSFYWGFFRIWKESVWFSLAEENYIFPSFVKMKFSKLVIILFYIFIHVFHFDGFYTDLIL